MDFCAADWVNVRRLRGMLCVFMQCLALSLWPLGLQSPWHSVLNSPVDVINIFLVTIFSTLSCTGWVLVFKPQ